VAVRTHEEASEAPAGGVLPLSAVGETTAALSEVFRECQILAAQKSVGYGDAWRQQGYMGNLARVLSKSARLRNLAWRDGMADEQAMEAELLDIINIAAMGLTNLRAGNRWGEQHG
jgi:hypothetical protein